MASETRSRGPALAETSAPLDDVHAEDPQPVTRTAESATAAVVVDEISRQFGETLALDSISLTVEPGELHALLGPNGAGKTTLLRLLTGLVEPTAGSVRILGLDAAANKRELRRLVGLVPSGDRTFYLRITALENLVFFARLYGFNRRTSIARARTALAAVELEDVANQAISTFSHGMQKRLSVARALLSDPAILLVDEATHDLDPLAATRVRELARSAADNGAAVLWATQRIEEIRGFADRATVLSRGHIRFTGNVSRLLAVAPMDEFLLRLDASHLSLETLSQALGRLGKIVPSADGEGQTYVLALGAGRALGEALQALRDAGAEVLGCTDVRPQLEQGFLALVSEQES
jgi:ABC-2 type transport system ATP-binding protein